MIGNVGTGNNEDDQLGTDSIMWLIMKIWSTEEESIMIQPIDYLCFFFWVYVFQIGHNGLYVGGYSEHVLNSRLIFMSKLNVSHMKTFLDFVSYVIR